MTALERAAMALREEMPSFVGEPYPHQSEFGASYIDCQEVDFVDLARAVLMAVREPDDATVTRACDFGYYSAPDLEIHFGRMIDAILNEKDTTNDH